MPQATVLLVDTDPALRETVAENLERDRWDIKQFDDVQAAWDAAVEAAPDLVVLNADLPKGWNLCTRIKRRFHLVPVVLLSHRAPREVFNNHQKLDTRADAYHKLPEDADRLGITLSYYASHGLEEDEDEGVDMARVAELGDALKAARKDLKAMAARLRAADKAAAAAGKRAAEAEAERADLLGQIDALAGRPAPEELEELRAKLEAAPEGADEGQLAKLRAALDDATQEAQRLRERLAAAEAAGADERERHEARLAQLRDEAAADAERASEAAAGKIEAAEAAREAAEQQLEAAREAEAAALERAETVERAWAGINARVERQTAALKQRKEEVDRLSRDKSEVEAALATSRKLMKEYGQAVARKKDEVAHLEEELQQARDTAKAADTQAASLHRRVLALEAIERAIPALEAEATSHAETLLQLLQAACARSDHFEARYEDVCNRLSDATELARTLLQAMAVGGDEIEAPPAPGAAPPSPDLQALLAAARHERSIELDGDDESPMGGD
ncbi:MAG: hypothetical protein CSA66_07180, partial [Proteobacteria bacterium]